MITCCKQPTGMYSNALLMLSVVKLFACDLVSTDYCLGSNQIVGLAHYIMRDTASSRVSYYIVCMLLGYASHII